MPPGRRAPQPSPSSTWLLRPEPSRHASPPVHVRAGFSGRTDREVDRVRARPQTDPVDTEERQDHEDQAVSQVIDRLAEKFPERPRAYIETVVTEQRHLLDGKPIRDYVPVLIEHGAKARLREDTGHSSAR
jgi:hypothetical protein